MKMIFRLLTNEQRQEFDEQVRKLRLWFRFVFSFLQISEDKTKFETFERENRSNPQDIRHRSLENVFANAQINGKSLTAFNYFDNFDFAN